MPKINFLRLLQVFMALMPIVIEGFYGMNWLVCVCVGGGGRRFQCHSVS
jgi:hypothetical protein